MKRIYIFLLIFLCNNIYADIQLKDAVYNGTVSVLENLIEANQLVNFSPNELRLLRNMIYAKHGYTFLSKDLMDFFSQFPWYYGIKNDISNILTNIDYQNIYLIQSLEDRYPVFIPHYDNYLYMIDEMINRHGGGLVILGWSNDGKLFYASADTWSNTWFYIFDLKTNKQIEDYNILNLGFDDNKKYEDYINKLLKNVSDEFNIVFVHDYFLLKINGFDILAKDITMERITYDTSIYSLGDEYIEIDLINNDKNITIKIDEIYLPVGSGYGSPVPITDLRYLCIRSPFEENMVAIIIIIPRNYEGDCDGPFTVYRILGFDLNALQR